MQSGFLSGRACGCIAEWHPFDIQSRHHLTEMTREHARVRGLRQALACSLRATNPGLPLVVMTVEGDLAPATLAAVAAIPNAQLRPVPDFYFHNDNTPRCAAPLPPRPRSSCPGGWSSLGRPRCRVGGWELEIVLADCS